MAPGGVVERVHRMPGREFLESQDDWVLIPSMTIMTPDPNDPSQYHPWIPAPASD